MKHLLTLRKRIRFYSALSDALRSGLPITRALQCSDRIVPESITHALFSEIDRGGRIRDVLPRIDFFPELDRRLLTIAEESGSWSEVLNLLSSYYSSRLEFLGQLLMGLAYPFFLINMAIFLFPLPTLVLGSTMQYTLSVLPYLLLLYGSAATLVFLFSNREFRSMLSLLPVIGAVISSQDEANFLLLTGMQLNSGIMIHTALENVENSLVLPVMRSRARNLRDLVASGGSISDSIKDSGLLRDRMMAAALASAEVSGNLPGVMLREAEVLKNRTSSKLKIITRVVPVAFYLIVAVIIGIRILNFYSGRFSF